MMIRFYTVIRHRKSYQQGSHLAMISQSISITIQLTHNHELTKVNTSSLIYQKYQSEHILYCPSPLRGGQEFPFCLYRTYNILWQIRTLAIQYVSNRPKTIRIIPKVLYFLKSIQKMSTKIFL